MFWKRPKPPARCELMPIARDLTRGDAIAQFVSRVFEVLGRQPQAIRLDLTNVKRADTKLAAALVAVVRGAEVLGVPVEIDCSAEVMPTLELCRVEDILCRHAEVTWSGRERQSLARTNRIPRRLPIELGE